MNIIDYPQIELSSISFSPKVEKQASNSGGAFDALFAAAIDIANETNRFQMEADSLQQDLATGRTDNMLSVLLAQEKAYSSLNFTVQAVNKAIESYREIMRMQL